MKIAKICRGTLNILLSEISISGKSRPVALFPNGPDFDAEFYNADVVYLSKRNVKTLISKLDRVQNGEHSYCSIIKRDTIHPEFPCSAEITVMAVEDEYDERNQDHRFVVYGIDDHLYYTERQAGDVHPKDLRE